MTEPSDEGQVTNIPGEPGSLIGSVNREKTLFRLSIITTSLFGVSTIAMLISFFRQSIFGENIWQYFGVIFAFSTPIIAGALTEPDSVVKNFTTRVSLLTISIQVSLLVFSLLVEGIAIPAGLISLIFSVILAVSTLPKDQTNFVVNAGIISAILIVLVGIYSPFNQLSVPLMQIIIPVILVIMILAYIVMLTRGFLTATMRIKLLGAFMVITLIPLAVITLLQTEFTRNGLQAQNTSNLRLAAVQSSNEIDNFISNSLYNTTLYSTFPVFSKYLLTPAQDRIISQESKELQFITETLKETQHLSYIESIGVLDDHGVNIFDSHPENQGASEFQEGFYQVPFLTGSSYVSPIRLLNNVDAFIVFSSPIRDERQKTVGVLRIRYNASILQHLVSDNANKYGEKSFPLIVDDKMVRLADSVNPEQVFKPITTLTEEAIKNLKDTGRLSQSFTPNARSNLPEIAQVITGIGNEPGIIENKTGLDLGYPEIGAVVKMKNVPWYLVYLQQQVILNNLLNRQTRMALVISTLVAGFASFFATLIARNFTNPIIQLTQIAEKIAAGEIETRVSVQSKDEVGTLAQALNSMTTQLRSSINELENRVNERTLELEKQNEFLIFRARQLQTISDVARDVASTQQLEALLPKVTRLISERFGFYHAGIFLIDENAEYAVLRAANSEGGLRMLARQHQLRVGRVGIVGYVTGTGNPRIATNVGGDAVFFNNPDLPETRSEMALPLKIGGNVIGALDVQSTQENAFSEEDIELFTILSDQIAIAISNNRLLEETNRGFKELTSLHQAYLHQEWAREVNQKDQIGFRYVATGAAHEENTILPEAREVAQTGKPLIQAAKQSENGELIPARLAIPIILRGEPIGAIQLEESGNEVKEWGENELIAIQGVADQIALALENARLFEQTIQRAERERKVLEITSKIRATNDYQAIIQVAVDELQQALHASRARIILKKPENLPSSGENNSKEPENPTKV